MDNLEQAAWDLYCLETKHDLDVKDFWEELSQKIQQLYIKKVKQNKALKPCPRCGSVAEIGRTAGDYGYYPPTVFPKCTNKHCGIRGPSRPTEKWVQFKGTFSVEDEAIHSCIQWWNYRAP